MNTSRITSAAVITLAGGLTLAGCSSEPTTRTSASTSTTVTTPSAAASASDSAAVTGGQKVAGATVAKQATAALIKSRTFQMTNDAPVTSQSSVAQVVVHPDGRMDTRSTYKVGGKTVQFVGLKNGAATYAQAPFMMLPKWTKLDLKSKNPAARRAAVNVSNVVAPAAPWNALRLLGAVQLTKVGQETVNGVKATKYTAGVPAKVVENMATAEQRQLLAGALAGKTSPMTFFADAQGRPVKQTMTINVAGGQTITSMWSKFGAPVTVKAPV